MVDQQNNQNQSRFLIAAVLSMVVLFGWSYFFTPTKPLENANTAPAVDAHTAQPQPAPAAPVEQPVRPSAAADDTTPNRAITIKSPLYEVTLDSKGAVATSWVLLQNKTPKGTYPIYADGSNDAAKKPLQLISQKALEQSPREVPFRLTTPDQNLTALANGRNYLVSVPQDTITLAEGQEQQIDFTLTDASGVEIKKSFVFRADSYIADL